MTGRHVTYRLRNISLDVGGEGRYPEFWNVNPSHLKTLGCERGEPIPRWIYGRVQSIPRDDNSVQNLIVERAPLMRVGVREILRVIRSGGTLVLPHANIMDPHEYARSLISANVSQRLVLLGNQQVRETIFREVWK